MTSHSQAQEIALVDNIDEWADKSQALAPKVRSQVFLEAEPLWVRRMIAEGKLFIHPEIADKLAQQSWQPNDLQKRMIWASVLASADGQDSKRRFKTIKAMLLKKYGRDWWEDVYSRKNSAWAARQRIIKNLSGAAVSHMIDNTNIFRQAASEERDSALRMISKS